MKWFSFLFAGMFLIMSCSPKDSYSQKSKPASEAESKTEHSNSKTMKNEKNGNFEVQKSEEEWKKELSEMEFYILREKGTERAFSGKYWDEKTNGIYVCAGCGQKLFDSDTKYKSGSGWPSFYKPIDEEKIEEVKDLSHGMVRTEVVCGRCGGHLGHVFPDGPDPTGLRYCINSASLDLKKEE